MPPWHLSYNVADLDSRKTSVWIIIPAHNRSAITRRCLGRLAQLEVHSWAHVLVVDDGSTDDTPRMLREEHAWAQVLVGPGDWWWAGAIHAGMSLAITKGADIICWMNDDTLPDAGALETLVKRSLDTRGMCGGFSRPASPGGAAYGGGRMVRRWPRAIQPSSPAYSAMVEWLHGNLVAIHCDVWRRIGLPRKSGTIHNFADIEYSFTAFQHGICVELEASATATAELNFSASYQSWRDPGLSFTTVWAGFWNPKMWWYLPGLGAFKFRLFGWRGMLDCIVVISKAASLPFYKPVARLFASRWA